MRERNNCKTDRGSDTRANESKGTGSPGEAGLNVPQLGLRCSRTSPVGTGRKAVAQDTTAARLNAGKAARLSGPKCLTRFDSAGPILRRNGADGEAHDDS